MNGVEGLKPNGHAGLRGGGTVSVTASAAAAEGATASYTVSLTGNVAANAYGVTATLAGTGGAIAGTDFGALTLTPQTGVTFVGGVLSFAAGVTSAVLTSAITADTLSPEAGEGQSVTLTAATGTSAVLSATAATATTAITDVPVTYTLTASAASVFEGAAIVYTLTASAASTSAISIDFSVVAGDTAAADQGTSNTNLNDFAAGAFNPSTVVMAAGATTATYSVTSATDAKTELPENYSVKAVVTGGATVLATKTTSLLDGSVSSPTTGNTYTLTTGADTGTAFTGTALNDTFNAITAGTFSVADTIDGGAGTDTMNWIETALIAAVPVAATVTGVEILKITSGATVVANVTAFTGLTSVSSTSSTSAAATNQITAAATTDVSVTAATLTDNADGMVTVNGGKNITVAVSGVVTIGADGGSEITVGGTTAAAGTVTVTNALTAATAAVQADVAVTGGTVITVTESLGNAGNTTNTQGIVTVTGNALTTTVVVNQDKAATAAAVVGGNAAVVGKVNGVVTIADVNAGTSTTDTITSVTLNSYAASTIDSTVLATLNRAGTGSTLAINKSTSDTTGTATTLALGITGGAAVGAITGTHAADFTTLNVTTTGTTASTIANATFTGVTTLAVSGTSKVTFTDNTFAALTTVTAGDGGLVLGTTALGNAVTFTGGAGDDAFIVGATTKALTLGTGNNTLTISTGTTALGTGGSVTAGAGTSDTLKFATTADAVTLSTANAVQTAFKAAVTGFERLTLAAAAGSVEVDVAGVLGATNGSYVTTTGVVTNVLTLKNLVTSGTGATVVINHATGTTNAGVTLTGTAGAGSADIVNLKLNDTATATVVPFGTLDALNVETVKVSMNDARVAGLAVPAQAISTVTITDPQLQNLTIDGNQSLNLTHTAGTALVSVDASGMTLGGLTFTSNANQYATTYTGSLKGGNIVSFAAATAGVTGTETAGTNSLTGSAIAANTLTGGSGADTLIGGVAADTLSGGAGADIISTQATGTLSGGADQITLGNGSDTVILRGDVAVSGAMTVAVATAAAARVTDFSISGTTTGVDILSLSSTFGNYNGASGFTTHLATATAVAAGATVVMDLGAASAGTALTAGTDLIHLTSATAVTGTLQALFNAAIGTSTATGISTAGLDIFFSVYDSTNSKMLVGVVDSGADTIIATGDTVTLVGSIDMTAANYALFTNANLAFVAA